MRQEYHGEGLWLEPGQGAMLTTLPLPQRPPSLLQSMPTVAVATAHLVSVHYSSACHSGPGPKPLPQHSTAGLDGFKESVLIGRKKQTRNPYSGFRKVVWREEWLRTCVGVRLPGSKSQLLAEWKTSL